MPITARLYEKELAALNVQTSQLPTVTPTPTISVTPSISITPSETPSISVTPSITVTISLTPTPSPSVAYYAVASKFNCLSTNNNISCGQYVGNTYIYSGTNSFSFGKFYASGSFVFQAQNSVNSSEVVNGYSQISNLTTYDTCIEACQVAIPTPTPTISQSVSVTPSVTPSITRTPSVTPSITPSTTP